MIGAIYSSMMGGSIFRGPESSARNISNTSLDGPRRAKISVEGRTRTSSAVIEEVKASTSDHGIQEAYTLFTEIDQVDYIQSIPRLIVAQRAYEASLKSLQTEDEMTRETLSILA